MPGIGFLGRILEHGFQSFAGILNARLVVATNPIAQSLVVQLGAKHQIVSLGFLDYGMSEIVIKGLLRARLVRWETKTKQNGKREYSPAHGTARQGYASFARSKAG